MSRAFVQAAATQAHDKAMIMAAIEAAPGGHGRVNETIKVRGLRVVIVC